MSLYTLSKSDKIGSIKIPDGIRIEKSSDVLMLSQLCNISIQETNSRLVNGNLAFIAFLNNQPAAFGWMATVNAKIGELNHGFVLPQGNRYLWNFRTFEPYRGKGIYPTLLQYILANGDNSASRFWIIHAPENIASLKGINKVGFKYAGKLYVDAYNTATIESTDLSLDLQYEIEYMKIKLSDEQASSCWNCSSPFLKKRSNECCCEKANNDCIGKRGLPTI